MRFDAADRDRPVGERRQDRVLGAAPFVEGEHLAGEHERARPVAAARGRARPPPAARRGARRRPPARRPRVPRAAAARRARRARPRPRPRAVRSAATTAEPAPRLPRGHAAEAGKRERRQRRRLVGGAQELDGLEPVVGEGERAAQRRPVGEAGRGDEQPEQQQGQEERPVAPAQAEGEPGDRECGYGERGDDHRHVEQVGRRRVEVRRQRAAVARRRGSRSSSPSRRKLSLRLVVSQIEPGASVNGRKLSP